MAEEDELMEVVVTVTASAEGQHQKRSDKSTMEFLTADQHETIRKAKGALREFVSVSVEARPGNDVCKIDVTLTPGYYPPSVVADAIEKALGLDPTALSGTF